MNSYTFSLGAVTLALIISSLPLLASANESTSTLEATRQSEQTQDSSRFGFETSTTSIRSLDELKRRMEVRREELDRDEASTSPEYRDSKKNENSMRLAVHALLDSRGMMGGIGEEVSKIAREMNDSIATTTEMESRIHSRGFFERLLFGGDRTAADVITRAVARNQQHIEDLNKLLNEANVSLDIQTTLKAQISALEDAQIRLRELSTKERGAWGLFSWRF